MTKALQLLQSFFFVESIGGTMTLTIKTKQQTELLDITS